VYVRDGSGTAPAAPLSIYHDLRILHCAGMKWDTGTSRAWLRGFQPDPEGIQQVDSEARSSLIAYEAPLDVRVSEHLTRPAALAGSFFTVNHPTNRAMQHIVAAIHAELGLRYTTAEAGEELLGALRSPLERDVIAALGLVAESRDQWTIKGQTFRLDELLALHLAWYEDRRGLVQAGLGQHETRMGVLGLLR
jgi:Polysaccharide biosynthesis enzyme WcbI